jgi:hypothetical protein
MMNKPNNQHEFATMHETDAAFVNERIRRYGLKMDSIVEANTEPLDASRENSVVSAILKDEIRRCIQIGADGWCVVFTCPRCKRTISRINQNGASDALASDAFDHLLDNCSTEYTDAEDINY